MGLGPLSPSRITDSGSPEASDSVYAESPHGTLSRKCAFAESFLSRPAYSARGEKHSFITESLPRLHQHPEPLRTLGQLRLDARLLASNVLLLPRDRVDGMEMDWYICFSYSSCSSTQGHEFEYGTPRKSRARPRNLRDPSRSASTLAWRNRRMQERIGATPVPVVIMMMVPVWSIGKRSRRRSDPS